MKYKLGLVIGRFQPFHKGHEYLLLESLKHCDQIIVGIGSANKRSKKNPWSPSVRRKMIKEFVANHKLESRVIRIVNLYDNKDDDVWFQNLIKKIGKFDVTLGNNPWNNGIIERHGIPVVVIDFHKRESLEGVQIRNLMSNNKSWKSRVPKYILPLLDKN